MSSPIKAWRDQKKIACLLKTRGVIKSLSMVRVPPAGFSSDAPYGVAIVETENGRMLFGQLTDLNGVLPKIGARGEVVYRRQKKPDSEGVIYYGLKFRLI